MYFVSISGDATHDYWEWGNRYTLFDIGHIWKIDLGNWLTVMSCIHYISLIQLVTFTLKHIFSNEAVIVRCWKRLLAYVSRLNPLGVCRATHSKVTIYNGKTKFEIMSCNTTPWNGATTRLRRRAKKHSRSVMIMLETQCMKVGFVSTVLNVSRTAVQQIFLVELRPYVTDRV